MLSKARTLICRNLSSVTRLGCPVDWWKVKCHQEHERAWRVEIAVQTWGLECVYYSAILTVKLHCRIVSSLTCTHSTNAGAEGRGQKETFTSHPCSKAGRPAKCCTPYLVPGGLSTSAIFLLVCQLLLAWHSAVSSVGGSFWWSCPSWTSQGSPEPIRLDNSTSQDSSEAGPGHGAQSLMDPIKPLGSWKQSPFLRVPGRPHAL